MKTVAVNIKLKNILPLGEQPIFIGISSLQQMKTLRSTCDAFADRIEVAQYTEAINIVFRIMRNDMHEIIVGHMKTNCAATNTAVDCRDADDSASLGMSNDPVDFFVAEPRRNIFTFHPEAAQADDVEHILLPDFLIQINAILK